MDGFAARAGRWFDRLNRLLAAVACALLVLIALAICVEIFGRAAFDLTNPWLVELSEITLLFVTFLGAAWVLGRDRHVAIDLLIDRLDAKAARYLHCALALASAAACFVVAWFGALTVIDQFENDIREPTMMAPLTFWITAIIPFGLTLLGIQFLRRGARAAKGRPLAIDRR